MHLNIEFKAKTNKLQELEAKFQELNPRFVGEDHQIDTYFNVKEGRLKLREGNIENALIQYNRKDEAGVKQSDILLYTHKPDAALKNVLINGLGVKVVVNKIRRIYFIGNVKFHFDYIESLGTFIEVEVIDTQNARLFKRLTKQANKYATFFEIKPEDYVAESYSDLMLALG
jgi:adenylate cyclase, class 2